MRRLKDGKIKSRTKFLHCCHFQLYCFGTIFHPGITVDFARLSVFPFSYLPSVMAFLSSQKLCGITN